MKKYKITDLSINLIMNTFCRWIPEFVIQLDSKFIGIGSSPQGQTVSIYEQKGDFDFKDDFLQRQIKKLLIGKMFDQAELDLFLSTQDTWNKNVKLAISVAFYYALKQDGYNAVKIKKPPKLFFNVLNGGLNAYTNPIFSDIPEFLLIPQKQTLIESLKNFISINTEIKEQLKKFKIVITNGHPVYDIGMEPTIIVKFLEYILSELKLDSKFTIAIDACASSFKVDGKYHFPISKRTLLPNQLLDYWLDFIDSSKIEILEDPFSEKDITAWVELYKHKNPTVKLIADDIFATNPKILQKYVARKFVDGVIVKPNQIGTVTAAEEFKKLAKKNSLLTISSHRSIETDSLFLMDFSIDNNVDFIKIGPFSDFSTILKINYLLKKV